MQHLAKFTPQIDLGGFYMSIGPLGPDQWDATEDMAAHSGFESSVVLSSLTQQGCDLKSSPCAPEWVRHWIGPFLVEVVQVKDFDEIFRAGNVRMRDPYFEPV